MTSPNPPRHLLAAVLCLFSLGTTPPAVALTDLTSILDNTANGGWAKVNLNAFSDAFPAPEDGFNNPYTVIGAWSSFAWDSRRGQLMLFGGGHGNYAGNEMYLWDGTTQLWGRGSLPSQVTGVFTPNGWVSMPVDFAAPPSMHTYDGNTYLPAADRFLLLGGPAYNYPGGPVKANGAATGPFLFDPSRADPTKVGGTTGSAVNPAVLGSQAWSNRDRPDLNQITIWSGTHGLTLTDTTVANTVIAGKDVIYRTGVAAGNQWLIATTINDVNNPALDTMVVLGANGGSEIYGAAGLDPVRGWFVGPNTIGGFSAYSTAGGNGINLAVSGPSFTEGLISGIDFDPTRGNFLVWTGAGDVWRLSEPSSGVLTDTWTLAQVTDGDTFAAGAIPDDMDVSGVRGKWHYIPNLDAFMALEGSADGDVWLYRPEGWVNPVPEPGTVAFLLLGLGVVVLRVRQLRRAAPH